MKSFYACLATFALGACNLAPDYAVPDVGPTPPAFKEMNGWVPAEPAADALRGDWWRSYQDPDLDALEEKLNGANQDIKAALARYEGARAAARYARADYFPSLTGGAEVTRQKLSSNAPVLRSNLRYTDYNLAVDASYEIDFWGKIRNEVAIAKSAAQASGDDLATIELSLRAEMATDYFDLRADDEAQAILDQTVDAYLKSLQLTIRRHDGGIASAADVAQAEAQYENARTQAADMHLKRGQLEHAIAVLAGEIPSNFSLPPAKLIATLPQVNPGLPSTLLERRPDVASAERQVFAANAQIGVARAAWFPSFDLLPSAGFEAGKASRWIESPSLFWAVGPSVSLPIFEGGRIAALNTEARFAYDQAVANYRSAALTGYREAEDAILALQYLAQENGTQSKAAAAAQISLKQYQDRYVGGVITYLDVVIVQDQALQAQLSSVEIKGRQLAASIALVKSLGGGWHVGDKPQ